MEDRAEMRGPGAEVSAPDAESSALPGDRRHHFRPLIQLILILWAAASVVLLLTTVPPWEPQVGLFAGSDDLDTYRDGARHVMARLPLYAGRLAHEHLYTYPPFSAIAFAPLGLLPHHVDKYIWMAANLTGLTAIVAVCFHMLGHRITRSLLLTSALVAIACAFLEPVRTTLFFGQINLMLMLLLVWDASRGEGSRLKGIGVGVAAGIKLIPLYFVLYYLALRQWRAAATAMATFAATVALGWIVLPDDSREHWTKTLFDTDRIGNDLLHPSVQSLRGTIGRLLSGPPVSAVEPLPGDPAPTWLWLLAAVCLVVVSMVIAVLLYRGGERLLAVTVAGLTAVVVSPFSWTHHWVWFVPVVVYVIHRAMTSRWWWWLVAGALYGVLGAWTYQFPVDRWPRIGLYLFPDTWVPWDVLVNLYMLVYVAIMIGAGVVAIQVTRTRRNPALTSNQTPSSRRRSSRTSSNWIAAVVGRP
jgi:alpha-1,2-mannosyltransferase